MPKWLFHKKLKYGTIILLLPFFAAAQPFPDLSFHSIDEKDGLSNNIVNSVVQDKQGIMWIATQNGLNRYDGTRVKKIISDPSGNNLLVDNNLISVLYDGKENLWITGSSSASKYHIQQGTTQTTKGLVKPTIFLDNGEIFFPTLNGLFQWRQNNQATKVDAGFQPFSWFNTTVNGFQVMAKGGDGNYWAAAANRIYRVSPATKKITALYKHPENIAITSIYSDTRNRLWIGTWGQGLYLFNTATGEWKGFLNNTGGIVLSFARWKHNNRQYIAVAGGVDMGLLLIDEETLNYRQYKNEFQTAENPEGLHVGFVYVDRDHNLWLGTNKGLKIISSAQNLYRVIPVVSPVNSKPDASTGAEVYNLVETNDAYWLTKRYEAGIFYFDKQWRLKKYWPQLPAHPSQWGKDLYPAKTGYDFRQFGSHLYIATDYGMGILNPATEQAEIIHPKADSLTPALRTIVAENDTNWWVRSYNGFVYSFNPAKKHFGKKYRVTDSAGNRLNVNYLLQTTGKQLLVATFYGLYRFEKTQERFVKMQPSNAVFGELSGMAEDKNGIIWIGTKNGIIGYNPIQNKVVKFFPEYPDAGIVIRVCVDKYNNVWFNCQRGYWCWMQDKQQMIRFTYNMGLPENRTESGFAVTSDGMVYGGAKDALVQFNPDLLHRYQIAATAVITDITAGNGRVFTETGSGKFKTISLAPDQRSINILFSVSEYSTPGNYELFYRISPGADQWTKTENGQVFLSNLSHGKHTVEVVGRSILTGEYSAMDKLVVTVRPYWYQTLLFKVFCLFAVSGLIYLGYRYRLRQVRKETRLKSEYENKMLQLEMQNLRSQMNPHFIFNSLNSINSFIVESKTHLASDYLTKFSRLIRLILENSKNDSIPLEKELETLRLYLLMESIRFEKKFTYHIETGSGMDAQMLKVPPMIIQPYAENAIWHGILHKAEEGHVEINISKMENYLLISIEDNGVGRAKAGELKSKNCNTKKSYGLEITAQRIMRLNGKNSIHTIDLIGENGQPAGTRIELAIYTEK
jgi:ligand-binding sensor domain-containing protein